MTITYRVARSDLAKAMRSMWVRYPRQRLLMGGFFLMFMLLPPYDGGLIGFIVKMVTSALIFLVIGWLTTTVTSLLPGKGRGIICEHTFTVLPEEWIEKTAVNETHGRWEAITGVIETKQHLLIIIDHSNTHVIPRSTVDADAYHGFLQVVREFVPKGAYVRPVRCASP
jgi:hypothetical protein